MARRAKKIKSNSCKEFIKNLNEKELLQKGFSLHKVGKLSKAKKIYQQLLDINENHPDALQLLGMVESEHRNHEKAIFYMEKSIKIKPNQPFVYNNLGNSHFNIEDFEKAEKYYKKAIELKSDYIEAMDNMGIMFIAQERQDEALELYLKISKMAPNYPQAYNNLGGIYFKKGNRLKAEASYLKAVNLDKNLFQALYNLGKLYKEDNKKNKAITYYKKAIEVAPNVVDSYYNLANLYRETNENEKALDNYLKAYKLNPDFSDILLNLALTYHHLHQDDEAKTAFKKYLKIKPSNTIKHMLDALEGKTPDVPPLDYVIDLFDNYASTFDSHLVKTLQYISPKKITKMIKTHKKEDNKANILDLGCGTGLVVENLKENISVGKTCGVDIAPLMIKKSKEKKIYDDLFCSDIYKFLKENDFSQYDIITSTDVFIYIGFPEDIIKIIGKKAKKGALFCFDFEKDDCKTYILRRTGRFAHNQEYMKNLCEKNGLKIIDIQKDNIRKELGKPIEGCYFIAQKQ